MSNSKNKAVKKSYEIQRLSYDGLFYFMYMNYVQVSIKASEPEQEMLISRLSDLNSNGFEQQADLLLAFFDEDAFDRAGVEEIIKNYSYDVQIIEDKNWNEVWESNFSPVIVDDFCAVRAHFHEPVTSVQHEIIITPKMSFGTGHHPTTFMMMQQMRQLHFAGKSVFDLGTGTGILAILAEKLGAASVEAIDVDEWSITNAKENLERNGCRRIQVYLSSKVPERQFDIILANINRNVILQYLGRLKNAMGENARLLLSGLLIEDEEDIVNACNVINLSCIYKIERDNWLSLLFIAIN